jgi:hypothetical protein
MGASGEMGQMGRPCVTHFLCQGEGMAHDSLAPNRPRMGNPRLAIVSTAWGGCVCLWGANWRGP